MFTSVTVYPLKLVAAEGFIYEWKFVTITPSRAMGFLTALNCYIDMWKKISLDLQTQ